MTNNELIPYALIGIRASSSKKLLQPSRPRD